MDYLSVKGVELQQVPTLKCLGEYLLECESVFSSSEDVNLFHNLWRTPDKVSLSSHSQFSVVLPGSGVIVIRITEHHERNPEPLDLLPGQQVGRPLRLQVVVDQAVV